MGAAIREAIASGVVRRDEVYVTSKVSPFEQGTAAAAAACDAILQRLGLGHVDLMLIHWPGVAKKPLESPINAEKRLETWRVLEGLHRRGAVRAVGVSNYEIGHLEELLAAATIPPLLNQVECHPLWPQEELREWCAARGVGVAAYSPFATGELLREGSEVAEKIARIAGGCGKTPAQVLLCWGLQKGCSAVPKSVRRDRIAEWAPGAPGMVRDPDTGRWLPAEAEAALDALGAVGAPARRKVCWNPSDVA